MARIYMVMSQKCTAIVRYEPKAVIAFHDKNKAKEFCDEKEKRAISNVYWIESVKVV